MNIKNQAFIVVVKEAQFYNANEISKKLEKPLVALTRLKQGKSLPKTFLEIALSDLEQAIFLIEGTKDLLHDNQNT